MKIDMNTVMSFMLSKFTTFVDHPPMESSLKFSLDASSPVLIFPVFIDKF